MAGPILTQFVDLNEVGGDAWRYNWPIGRMRPEDTDPRMISQPQSKQSDVGFFPPMRPLPGFKLALDRLFRMGGNRGTPSGPPLSSPRLRRKLTATTSPKQMTRVAENVPAGLIDDTPAYERFIRANPDDYIGS